MSCSVSMFAFRCTQMVMTLVMTVMRTGTVRKNLTAVGLNSVWQTLVVTAPVVGLVRVTVPLDLFRMLLLVRPVVVVYTLPFNVPTTRLSAPLTALAKPSRPMTPDVKLLWSAFDTAVAVYCLMGR